MKGVKRNSLSTFVQVWNTIAYALLYLKTLFLDISSLLTIQSPWAACKPHFLLPTHGNHEILAPTADLNSLIFIRHPLKQYPSTLLQCKLRRSTETYINKKSIKVYVPRIFLKGTSMLASSSPLYWFLIYFSCWTQSADVRAAVVIKNLATNLSSFFAIHISNVATCLYNFTPTLSNIAINSWLYNC